MLLFLAGRHTRVTLVSVQYVGGKDWGTCGIRHTLQTSVPESEHLFDSLLEKAT